MSFLLESKSDHFTLDTHLQVLEPAPSQHFILQHRHETKQPFLGVEKKEAKVTASQKLV
jgi:hypothetical protein